jgi:ectoine hydroxylase-related dioxygenase (phytanoyl-CoA dioxygenase family)
MIDIDALRETMARDGVACLRGLLSAAQLADVTAAYEWTRDHRSPAFTTMGGDDRSWQDLSNPESYAAYAGMLSRSPIPPLLKALWGGGPVWYMYEQIFHKEATENFTPWHQDTPYMPIAGEQLAVCWISLEGVSRASTLEYCRGSHLGPVYNGSSFKPGEPTDPFYKAGNLPRLPDIEADRSPWDIVGWETEPGDVVLFHPGVLHGGGSPGKLGLRRTLTLRFFGEDVVYESRPGPTAAPRVPGLHESLGDGDPFRHPMFPLLA